MKKNNECKVYCQKGHGITAEFCGFDSDKHVADFGIDLGSVNVDDEMLVSDLIKMMEKALKLLKAHKGDVFVVQ